MVKNTLSLSVLFFLLGVGLASATSLNVFPREVGKSIGETFDLNVNIQDVEDLFAYEFKLSYEPGILEIMEVKNSFLNEPTNEIKKMVDEEEGFLWFAVTSLNPAEPKSGSGTLATITFRVRGTGRSELKLYDVQLSDSNAELIEHSVSSGVFDNTGVVPWGTKETLSLIILLILVALLLVAIYSFKK